MQKYLPATNLNTPCQRFHLNTTLESSQQSNASQNKTREPKKPYRKRTDAKVHSIINSDDPVLNQQNLYPENQSAQSMSKDSRREKLANPHLAIFRSDGLDPLHYSLVYNNVKETELFGTKRHLIANVGIRLGLGWMVANLAFVSVVDFHVIPQHLQIFIGLAAVGYIYTCYRFIYYRKAYRETVFRLYKENYGFNKKYVMIRPYMFTSSKQKVFTELEMKLDQEKHPERFQLNWRKYRLVPENFLPSHKSFLWEVLGHKYKPN
ncbi:uncharacterized protein LOC117338097 isoform X2 [Pecten maximus]|uniref:uncharacterized protein LOC117338097 isoform X2 n=1 Tax=Pecten maximus TaxID=6579 RepID=UPI00145894D8|nr:uncharacterized protein LOC117338097 isoform X2 [Pecten maximus]